MAARLKRLLLVFVWIALAAPSALPAALAPEAGFTRIDPIHFYFQLGGFYSRLELASSPARMWSVFQPADSDAEHRPLFVFFNGGFGSATSSGLMSMKTGPMALDTTVPAAESRFVPNADSWTRIGNLLYIDAPQTGFSYHMVDRCQDAGIRWMEFNAKNINTFLDSGYFIRVILALFERHPELAANPVVLVGESFGGTRATVMLHILLNYAHYGDGTAVYQDPDLAARLGNHYRRIFSGAAGVIPAQTIARQFGHQVLIQPAFTLAYQGVASGTLFEQDGSVIFQLAAEQGKTYVPCRLKPRGTRCTPNSNATNFVATVLKKDLYHYGKPANWLTGYFSRAARLVQEYRELAALTRCDVGRIEEFYAANRAQAFRVVDPDYRSSWESMPASSLPFVDLYRPLAAADVPADRNGAPAPDLHAFFGALQPWDRYFLDLNQYVTNSMYNNIATMHMYFDMVSPDRPFIGTLFLQNLVHVRTFITAAKYDLVVYAPAIPHALRMHGEHVQSVVHETSPRPGEERPGWIRLRYQNGAFGTSGAEREIRFPFYADSGHAVSLTEPAALLADVTTWLHAAPAAAAQGGVK